MRELAIDEAFEVDGGVAPAVWVAVTVGSAIIGAAGGYFAGKNSASADATVDTESGSVTLSCSAN